MTLDNRLHNCSFTYQKSYHLAWKRGSAFGPKMKLESLLPLIFDLASFQSHPLLRHVMYTKIVYIISSNPHFCGDLDKWWCRLYPSTNKKTTSLITVTIFGNPCPKKNIILSIPSSIIPIQVSQTPKTRKNPQNMLTIIHCMSKQHHEVLSTAALRLYGVLESLYGFA